MNEDWREKLEVMAVTKELCHFGFRGDNGVPVVVKSRVMEVRSTGDGWYILLENGLRIENKQLISLNDESPEAFC